MIKKLSLLFGIIGGVSSIILWFLLNFKNPYSSLVTTDTIGNTFFLLLLPALLALFAAITAKRWLMLLAFIWALPISLYLALTPGIFALYGVTCLFYFASFLCMRYVKFNKI
jgi:hypothetical protein